MSGKVLRIFLNADFRCQHDGLVKIAADNGLDLKNLKPNNHVVFINAKYDRIKMISPGGVLSYVRLENGKVNLEALQAIPKAFDGDLSFAYDKALTKTIREKLHIEK